MHRHLPDRFQRQPGVVPRRHSADQVAGEPGVTGADKIADDFMSFSSDSRTSRSGFLGSSSQPAQIESIGLPPILSAP
jgi:hypothetical protein